MRMRYLFPLALVTFGLALTAMAQEATPPVRMTSPYVTRTYPVADLVVPFTDMPVAVKPTALTALTASCAEKPCCAEKACPVPATAAVPSSCPATCATKAECCAEAKPAAAKPTQEARLIQLITKSIVPSCWSCNGGTGTVDYYPVGMALVVTAEHAVHERVAELLQGLRRLQDLSVAVDVRVISTSDDCLKRAGICFEADGLERIGVDFSASGKGQSLCQVLAGTARVAFLNDLKVSQLMEALQGDPRTTVLSTPKLMVLNGQAGKVHVGEEMQFVTGVEPIQSPHGQMMHRPRTESRMIGFQFSVQPTVSADGKYVQINLHAEHSSLASPTVPLFPVTTMITPVYEGGAQGKPVPFTQYIQQPAINVQAMSKVVCVPDGGTVVLGRLKRTREVQQECSVPVLSKVPYMNRLFKNVGYGREMENVIMLVTPRIVCNKEMTACTPPDQVKHPRPVPPTAMKMTPPLMMAMPMPMPQPVQQATYQVHMAKPTEPAGTTFRAKQVARLMEMYHEACAAGQTAEAKQLAGFALEMDPTCFSKARPMPTVAPAVMPAPVAVPVPPPARGK